MVSCCSIDPQEVAVAVRRTKSGERGGVQRVLRDRNHDAIRGTRHQHIEDSLDTCR